MLAVACSATCPLVLVAWSAAICSAAHVLHLASQQALVGVAG